jgi:hypothetical protein
MIESTLALMIRAGYVVSASSASSPGATACSSFCQNIARMTWSCSTNVITGCSGSCETVEPGRNCRLITCPSAGAYTLVSASFHSASRSCARTSATSACFASTVARHAARGRPPGATGGHLLLGRRESAAAGRRDRRAAAHVRLPALRIEEVAGADSRKLFRLADTQFGEAPVARVASMELPIDATRLVETSICASVRQQILTLRRDVRGRRCEQRAQPVHFVLERPRVDAKQHLAFARTRWFGATGTSMTRPVTRGRTCTTYFTTCTSSADGATTFEQEDERGEANDRNGDDDDRRGRRQASHLNLKNTARRRRSRCRAGGFPCQSLRAAAGAFTWHGFRGCWRRAGPR